MDFGPGTTLSLKDDFTIKLPPEEWTDFGLPFRFDIRLADILESNTEYDSLHFYSWVTDSTNRFGTEGILVPGFPDKQDPNTILEFSNGGGFSVYNPYNRTVTLKIPPVPIAMSPNRPAAKTTAKGSSWSVKVICRTDSGAKLPDLYCGYAEGNTFCRYPSAPSFSSAKVSIFDRETNRLYGHHIAGLFDGAITREIAFSNNSRRPVTVNYDLQKAGTFPTGINASLLNPSSGEWQSRGSVTVAAGSTEYRWLIAADEAYREMFKVKTLSFKYALRSVYPNPFRSVAHIRYTVPTGAKETLCFTLHDALGRKVWEKVINGSKLSVGEHSISWDGHDLRDKKVQSGAYFLSLSVIDSGKRTVKKFQSKLTFIP